MSSAFRERLIVTAWLAGVMALVLVAADVKWSAARAMPVAPAVAAVADDGLAQPGVLRVAADPNDLPFSNEQGEGFENKIAELAAKDLGVKVEYQWRAQRRGFVRETLKAGTADVMMGVPTSADMTLPTIPYYRSSYAIVYRKVGPVVTSLDDPALKRVKVGIPLTGDSGTPASYALAKRGIVENLVGYSVYGDYAQANPTSRIIEAVANKDVDVAVVWGPLAGYFASRQKETLVVAAITQDSASVEVPFAFNISMGVRRGNKELKNRLDQVITRRRADIERILDSYGVPRLPLEQRAQSRSPQAPGNATATSAYKACDCQ